MNSKDIMWNEILNSVIVTVYICSVIQWISVSTCNWIIFKPINYLRRWCSSSSSNLDILHIQRSTVLKVPLPLLNHHILYFKFQGITGSHLCKFLDCNIYTATSIYTQHSMEWSSKRVFRLRAPIGLHWTRRYKAGYEILDSTADGYDEKRKPNRPTAPPTLRLGRRKKMKGLFIAGICRRFRVRIVRTRSYSWGLLLKKLKAFYLRLLTEIIETAPTVEMLIHSGPHIYPHSF